MATTRVVRGVVRPPILGRRSSKENVAFGVAKIQDAPHVSKLRSAPFTGKDVNASTSPPATKKSWQGSQPVETLKPTFQTKAALKRRQGVSNATYAHKTRRVDGRVKVEKQAVTEPEKKCDTSKLELRSLKHALECTTSPPEGIADIDDHTDLFWSPEYAKEIVCYLQAWEKKQELPKNYLDNTNLSSKVHLVLVDWLIQVQEHLRLEQQTLHMCVALLHRFIQLEPRVPLPKIQLIGVTALLIASKFFERFAPSVNDLVHLTDNSYTAKEVLRMERQMLKVLKFQIHMCLPTDYAERFLKVSSHKHELESELVNYLLDASLIDRVCASLRPSRLAAAAVSLAHGVFRQGKNLEEQSFDKSLHYYSGWNSADLQPIKQRLIQLFVSAEESKYHAAFDKYKKEKRHKVSLMPELKNLSFLKRAADLSTRSSQTPPVQMSRPRTRSQTKSLNGHLISNTQSKFVTAL